MISGKPLRQGRTRSRTGELRYHQRTGSPRGAVPTAAERATGRPDADFNFVGDDGRRSMPLQYLHPADGHEADSNGMVDLTPHAGRLVRMMPKGVRLVWSCDQPIVNTLVEQGAIAIAEGYEAERYRYLLIDPASTRRQVFDRWHDHDFEPGSLEASHAYGTMRSACRIPGSEMPSSKALDGAFRVQRETGHFGWTSLLTHFPMVPAVRKDVLAYMRARLKRYRDERAVLPSNEALSHEELVILEPVLAGLRNSCLSAIDAHEHRQPSERLRKMLWQLDRTRTIGCIHTYAILGSAQRDETGQTYTSHLRRFERHARSNDPHFDPRDEVSLGRAFDHIAFSERLDGVIGRTARYWMCRHVRVLLRRTRRFCLAAASPASLLDAAPADHPHDALFQKRLRSRYADLRPQERCNRKRRSDEVARRYDRIVDGAAFRCGQIARDGAAGRAASDWLMLPVNADAPFRQYEVEDDELDPQGLPTGRRLTKVWRCWRTAAAWTSMRKQGASVRETGSSVHYREKMVAGRASEQPRPFVHELVEVLVAGGHSPILPWYVVLTDASALISPGHLTLDQRLRRHECHRSIKLPEYTGTTEGFVGFERDRSTLARLANALPSPRRFIPLEELELAMLMAGHGLDTVVQTWCRPHEFQQQTAYLEDWRRRPEECNDLDEPDDWGFHAIRKAEANTSLRMEAEFIPCSEALFVSAMNLVALLKRRFFADGVVPIAKSPTATWKVAPAPWIFSGPRGAIEPAQLTYMLRILLAGIADATFHDFRHAGSERANQNGAIMSVIMAGLGHRSERLARYYSRLALEHRDERRRAVTERKRSEAAAMRASALLLERATI